MNIDGPSCTQLHTLTQQAKAGNQAATPATNSEPKLLQGRKMVMELGGMVLGSANIEKWEKEGLKTDYEAYEKAFNTLNQAMQ